MNSEDLVELLKTETAKSPAQLEERVWAKLHKPRRTGVTRFVLVGATCALAAFVAMAALHRTRPEGASAPLITNRARIAPQPGSTLEGKTSNAILRKGRVLVSAWGEPVSIQVGSHKVASEAAVFWVQTAGDHVEVGVYEGIVMVDGEQVTRSAAREEVEHVLTLEAPTAAEQRQWFLVNNSLRQADVDDAITRLGRLADQSTLGAEAALLKKGQVELWQKHDAVAARLTLQSMLARFPHSALAPDAELSLLEALVEQSQWLEVRSGARRFVEAHPRSERLNEVAFIEAVALWNTEAHDDSCRALKTIERNTLGPTQRETYDALVDRCPRP